MKRGKKILALFLIITMLLPFVMNIPAEAAEKSKQLDVLFTHDTHSHLNSFSTIVDGEQKEVGGFAKLKTLIDEKKKENPDTPVSYTHLDVYKRQEEHRVMCLRC